MDLKYVNINISKGKGKKKMLKELVDAIEADDYETIKKILDLWEGKGE